MDTLKKTKIIATIGPASDSIDQIKKLILSGTDVFRFNTKHSTVEWHKQRIRRVRKIAEEMKKNVGIMIDLQGSEVRIKTRNQEKIEVKSGETINIAFSLMKNNVSVVISNKEAIKKLRKNDIIFINDGMVELKITEKKPFFLRAKIIEGKLIENGKSVNFPKTKINFSSLVGRDIEFLNCAVKDMVDFIALSFVNCKEDISILRKEMKKRKINALIVSKIEGQGALDNVDEIIENSEAMMVARGDLGIEAPIQELAYWQKKIIDKSRKKGLPVIVATQMLHSMINNPRPSRAEATDVANAVFDGADALMLSEETAIGKYPIKTVEMMEKIIRFNEKKSTFLNFERPCHNLTEFVTGAFARELLKRKLGIKTTVVFTETGYTARVLSSFRPQVNIVALSDNKEVVKQLSMSYGIISFYNPVGFNNFELPKKIVHEFKKIKVVFKNETIAVFHGRDNKKPNLLNLFSLTKIK